MWQFNYFSITVLVLKCPKMVNDNLLFNQSPGIKTFSDYLY
ncbi:hypothetical protein N644_1419 [Lactiplantibacillus paraplantarum]|nr:hypothetical protein N644_1419 [Lactiplantibacillus paraplantarum]